MRWSVPAGRFDRCRDYTSQRRMVHRSARRWRVDPIDRPAARADNLGGQDGDLPDEGAVSPGQEVDIFPVDAPAVEVRKLGRQAHSTDEAGRPVRFALAAEGAGV